jgi:hypothetical protein
LLKNPPRGYDKDHPAIDLLKLKSFESSHKIKFEVLLLRTILVTMAATKLILLKPLNEFIGRAYTEILNHSNDLKKNTFLGESYRADAITWMNGLKEFGDFEIICWD